MSDSSTSLEQAKIFSSRRPGRNDDFAEQLHTLATAFPEYRWNKATPNAANLRRALGLIADFYVETSAASHQQLARILAARITAVQRAITGPQAAELDAMLQIAQTAHGTVDWPRVVLCEMSILGHTSLPPEILDAIKIARVANPTSTGGVLECRSLCGIPVRSAGGKRQTHDADDRCWRCGKPWSKAHTCADADILAHVKSQKPGSANRRRSGF